MCRSVSIVAVFMSLPLAAQQQTVSCAARNAVQTCAADTSNGALLIHERSTHACQLGKTWRYDERGIHVSKGCDADFLVSPKHSNAFGEGGYRTSGTGVDAFHTNGHVGPSGGRDMRGVDQEGSETPKQGVPQPK